MKKFFNWFKSLKWYWKVATVIAVLIPIGMIAPDKKASDSFSTQSTYSTKYYKCRWCGKSVSEEDVLTVTNSNLYKLENGFGFCSQECFREWRSRQ